jgi:hypothetical protein
MRTRRGVLALATAALLALGGSASAAATDRPAPASDGGVRHAKRCDRFDHALTKLERMQTRLEKRIARIEAKIAGGGLAAEELARARAHLAKLQNRLEKREALIDRLEAKFAEKCAADA